MKIKKIKRSIFAILIVVTLFLCSMSISSIAVAGLNIINVDAGDSTIDEAQNMEFKYQLAGDEEIWIRQYIGNQKSVIIPEYIDGIIVAGIDGVEYLVSDEVEDIFIPKTISHYICAGMFESPCKDSHLQSITVSEENSILSSQNGVLYNKDKTEMICYPINKRDNTFTIPKTVTSISCYAYGYETEETPFYGNKYLKKLYVYDNSYGLEWAKSHDFPYVIIEESPVEKDIVDEETGIQVNGLMDSDAVLNVESVENTVENAVSTFNITLKKDGNIIQPSGTITISIPSEYTGCNVFWIKDDGTKVNMNAEYKDGNYIFTTDHLSIYALVKEPVTTEPEPTGTNSEPTEIPTSLPDPTKPIPTVPDTTKPITTVPEPTITGAISNISTPDTNNGSNNGTVSTDNGAIQTGSTSIAVIILLLLSSFTTGLFVYYRRKIK